MSHQVLKKRMNKLLAKKINLLLHLAKIDGCFDESERVLLTSFLKDNGLEENYLEQHKQEVVDLKGLVDIVEKSELLFWILKVIYADGQLHPTEVAYSEIIATRLGFKKEIVTHFMKSKFPHVHEFIGIAN